MEIVYIVIGIVIGVVASLFLDVNSWSRSFSKKEKEFDEKNE
jgi:uncharacterized membrane protein YqgA involved in biofilm formation